MNITRIDKLFSDLNKVTNLENIAFHKFVEGQLFPVHMMSSKVFKAQDWKKKHGEDHVEILEDPVLKKVVKGEIVFINDTVNNKESSPKFAEFNIKSIAVFPLLKEGVVFGIIVIPSLINKFEFSSDIIDKCKMLIEIFNEEIL